MEFKPKNLIFFGIAILLFILFMVLGNMTSNLLIRMYGGLLLLYSTIAMAVFGILNYTNLKLGIKIIITVVASGILYSGIYMLMWMLH